MSIIHTFTWRMFHQVQVYGDTVEAARLNALAGRPDWVPEGTELRYLCSRGKRDDIARMNGQCFSIEQNVVR
jgi:hypothetical protein